MGKSVCWGRGSSWQMDWALTAFQWAATWWNERCSSDRVDDWRQRKNIWQNKNISNRTLDFLFTNGTFQILFYSLSLNEFSWRHFSKPEHSTKHCFQENSRKKLTKRFKRWNILLNTQISQNATMFLQNNTKSTFDISLKSTSFQSAMFSEMFWFVQILHKLSPYHLQDYTCPVP